MIFVCEKQLRLVVLNDLLYLHIEVINIAVKLIMSLLDLALVSGQRFLSNESRGSLTRAGAMINSVPNGFLECWRVFLM